MHKKFGLWLISGLLLILITAPIHAQDAIPTIKLPPLQPITIDNINDLQLLGVLDGTNTILNDFFITDFILSPDHRWMAAYLRGGVLMLDLQASTVRILESNVFSGKGAFSNDGRWYVNPLENSTNIYDTNTWAIIATLQDTVTYNTVFSPDNRFFATTLNPINRNQNEADTLAYEERLKDIYLFETDTWAEYGTIPQDYNYSRRLTSRFTFQSSDIGNYFITYSNFSIHRWDYLTLPDYSDPDLIAKDDFIAGYTSQRYADPNGLIYQWVGYIDTTGLYALWLTSPDGGAIFAKPDGTYEDVTIGESGENHDENGIPTIYGNYTRLERRDMLPLLQLSESGDITFGTPTGNVVIINRNEASQTLPRYTYDSNANTLTDNERGIVFVAQEVGSVGYFTAGDDLSLTTPYRLEGFPLPETLLKETQLPIAGMIGNWVSYDGHYTFLQSDNSREITLYNLLTGNITPILEGVIPPIEGTSLANLGETFRLNITPDGTVVIVSFYNQDLGINQLGAWDIQTGEKLGDFDTNTNRGISTLSADGQLLVIGGGLANENLEFWGVPQP